MARVGESTIVQQSRNTLRKDKKVILNYFQYYFVEKKNFY